MRKIFLIILAAIMVFATACSGSESSNRVDSPTISADKPQADDSSVSSGKSEMYIEVVAKNGNVISFKLNDSVAAREFYEQLPLSISVEDYAGSEKIFYPPKKLNTENTPAAKGPAGTLAYYEPWGDIAFFYSECGGASGLYELGNVVSGAEYIKELAGEIEIVKVIDEVSNAASTSTSSESIFGSSDSQMPTPTSEPIFSDNASSNAVNNKEPEGSSFEVSEGHSSTTSQSSVTNGTTVPNQTPNSDVKSENSFDTSTGIPEISSTVTVSDQEPEQSTVKEENALSIEITVNGRTFSATIYDNETARAFSERLPLTLDMSELNGNEKYYYLPDSLPRDSSRPPRINAGDIMLYGSDCLVIFYESFSTSYSYTPIGKIDDPDGLAAALGSGSVQVAFN